MLSEGAPLELEDYGYEVLEAATGDTGLLLYWATKVDLVITDLIMPGKDGLTTIAESKRSDSQASIIVVAASARNLNLARKAGADHFLLKPLDPEELVATIRGLHQCRIH